MRKYKRSTIENFILRSRATDLSQVSDDYLADQLATLRRMKDWLDVSEQETRAKLTLVTGGKT